MTFTFTEFKKRIAILAIFCMLFTLMPVNAFALGASDISGHWAEGTIQSWVDNGLIKGYPDGTFKPDNNITRAEFITLVNRAFSYTKTAPISFTDVDQNAWYASAISVAVEAGYISGYPDGTMRPDNPISREEAATIIMKINKLEANPSAANTFTDAASLTWSKGAVGAVFAAGIMVGYPDGSFGPQKLIKRGEATVTLDRAMKYIAGSVTPLAPSVTRNDDTNTVTGMTTAMEYKLDSANYATYVAGIFNALDFSGNHTLMVRFAASGINPFGPATTLTFTTNVITVTGNALPVDLGMAGDYVILAKTGISTDPASNITGNIGVSPAAASYITGFSLDLPADGAWSTSTQVTGQVYAPGYANPTPANLTTAVLDMEAAYRDAAGRDANYTELYSGDISGRTLTAGVYKWGTGVLITSDVTLDGGPNDVWIFQIAKGITQASDTSITLTGGAQAKNIFWQAADTVSIGTTAHFEGIVLAMTNIELKTGATVYGRLLAQTAVTLQANTVTAQQ